jgi:DNA-binding beta-propeller fold protein YncE
MKATKLSLLRGLILGTILLFLATGLEAAANYTLSVKCFPPGSVLSEGGKALKAISRDGLFAKYSLSKGGHELSLGAPGYLFQDFSLKLEKNLSIQKKLERIDTGLAFKGLAACGPKPKSLLYSPDGLRLFAALLDGTGVDVIDVATMKKTATWSPSAKYAKKLGFVELAIHEARGELWVSQMTTGSVHIFDLQSGSYLATVLLGSEWSKVILFSRDGATAYVSNWVSRDVSVVSVAERKVLARYKCSGIPRGMVTSPEGQTLYVANFDLCAIDVFDLTKPDKKTGVARSSWNFGKGAMRHLLIDDEKRIIYASDMDRARIFAISIDTGKMLREAKVGPNPNTIEFSKAKDKILVSTRGTNGAKTYLYEGPDFGTLEVFDSDSFAKTDWASGGNQPTGLSVNPIDGSFAFSDFLDARIEFYSFK